MKLLTYGLPREAERHAALDRTKHCLELVRPIPAGESNAESPASSYASAGRCIRSDRSLHVGSLLRTWCRPPRRRNPKAVSRFACHRSPKSHRQFAKGLLAAGLVLALSWASVLAQTRTPTGIQETAPAVGGSESATGGLRVGVAAAELEADDSMIIAGGITPGKVSGQEGKLRAVAMVVEKPGQAKLAIAACDILMITRAWLDPAVEEIERATGIPRSHILINSTHTHHAPSTMAVHAYGLDQTFAQRVQRGIVKAALDANANVSREDCHLVFHVGEERTVGQNSRQLLSDGQIYWVGPRDQFVRPTGPFDPELPVLAFRDSSDKLRALIFNHSTHTIGTRQPGKRSPSFYGLAAQDLEEELGGIFCFLEGASGSTHNLTLSGGESTERIKKAVRDALAQAKPRPVPRLAALKRPFKFKVRQFDEAKEDDAVVRYCRKWVGAYGEQVIRVFRDMRKELAPQRAQERETWLQAMLLGDIAVVGVPAEYFTKLGLDIKNRSPFRHTYVAELANDWIGYLPDLDAHKLGGYQVWTGLHSYAEPGTGERIVDEVVTMLNELAKQKPR